MTTNLAETISLYQVALEALPTTNTPLAPAKVMSVFVTRDALVRSLTEASLIDAASLSQITLLDQRLKAGAATIDAIVGRSTLAQWRESIQPPASSWWWSLDELAAAAEPQPSPLWAAFTGFLVASSFSLTAEMGNRFLSGGADFIGTLSTLFQGLLTLVAGSSLTDTGAKNIDQFLSRLGVKPGSSHIWKTGLALIVLLVIVGFRLLLPAIAGLYNSLAESDWLAGRSNEAVEKYQRAISLQSGFAEAHFKLANAFERLLEFDQALSAFQNAIRANPLLYPAYNRLARLQIKQFDDNASALQLLNQALALDPQPEAAVQYEFYTNRGWANFNLAFYEQAETDLRQALELRQDGAAAHCLLAQVLEAPDYPEADAVLAEWQSCLTLAEQGKEQVEAVWVGLARERVATQE